MRRMVRVELAVQTGVHQKLTLDLILESDKRPREGVPFCGWFGKLESTLMLPVIVRRNGQIDFGSDDKTNQEERYGNILLHGRIIDFNEMITYNDGDSETLYRIKSITDLLEN
jgi:hypothetical protein